MQSSNLLLRYMSLAIICSFVVIGCKKDDTTTTPTPSNVTVSGTVHTFGGQAIANAAVSVFSGSTISGTPAATATSNATGQWQVGLSGAGRYTRVITATGLPTSVVSMNIASGQTTVDEGITVLAAQTINGTINDALTGNPVSNATVRFFSGANNDTSGYRFNDLTTNSQGSWTNSFTFGSYVAAVYASNHVPLVTGVSVTDTTTRQWTTTVTVPVATGQMRLVLNWGAEPSDLDSHLTGDSSTTAGRPRYHVYWDDQVALASNGDTIATLDHDDVTSFGPETITIFRFFPGTLRYKIHDYTNRFSIGSHYMSDSSVATVRVYTSAGLLREDHIRTGTPGNQWYVYNIDGATQQISFVNTIRDSVSSYTDSTFRPTVLPPKPHVRN